MRVGGEPAVSSQHLVEDDAVTEHGNTGGTCLRRRWALLTLFCTSVSVQLQAAAPYQTPQAAPAQHTQANQLTQANQICTDSLTACLEHVEPLLAQSPVGSLYWRELMLLKLDSLFYLQRGQDVLAITTKLLQHKDWPPNFLARLYIYHAKELHAAGRTLESQHYIQKVSEMLNSFHAADRLPLTELRLVNVRMYIDGDRQAAYDQLKSMAIRYDATGDWDMRFSIYHNLAHVSEFLDKQDDATTYRDLALALADDGPNLHYKALTRYYRARLALQQHDYQDHYYEMLQQAEQFARQIDADFLQVNCHLLQVELALKQHQMAKAQQLFDEIKATEVADESRDEYQRVRQLLTSPRSSASPSNG